MPPEPQGSPGEALRAIARLLDTAAQGSGPAAAQAALLKEARALLGVPAAALLAVSGEPRTVTVAAPPPTGPPAQPRHEAIEAVLELVGRGLPATIVEGPAAAATGAALGLGAGDGALLLVALPGKCAVTWVLALGAAPGAGFDQAQAELAQAFAAAAACAFERLRLAGEHNEQLAQQAALVRAAKTLNESLDLARVLTRICDESAGILGADIAGAYLVDEAGAPVLEATFNLPEEALGLRLEPGTGLAGRCVAAGRPVLSNDYAQVARGMPAETPWRDTLRSALAAPIHWDGALRGVLTIGYTRPREATEDDLKLLGAFAELAAVACANASAHADMALAARTDGLTGCLNHAALQEALRREVDRCRRTGHELSLVLLDLDDFKQVNERHGHLVGDAVLRDVGRALRRSTRPYDVVARYGGDEFAVLMVDASEAEACELAARALARLERAVDGQAGAPGVPAGIRAGSATAGVAAWQPADSPTLLIAAADRALMSGKRRGERGAVVAASALSGSEQEAAARPQPAPEGVPWSGYGVETAERLRRRTRQLALANALGTRLAGMTDVDSILDAAVEELHRAFGYYTCGILRLRPDDAVEVAAARGRGVSRLVEQGWAQPKSVGLIGRCLRERRAVVANDVSVDPDFVRAGDDDVTRAELVAPLWVGGELWGAMNVEELRRDAFDQDDMRTAQTIAGQIGSAMHSADLYEQLERAYMGTAQALAAALEAKDFYTASHSRSVLDLAEQVGWLLGLAERDMQTLRYGAIFHDIGKIAIPEAILHKRGPLLPEEWELTERHPEVGAQILAPVEFLADVLPVVRHQHERWDGQGYPERLAGEEIPLGSRIVLACDAYHAMTSDRPYRAALPEANARAELRDGAGTQFDPRVVDALLAVLDGQDGTVEWPPGEPGPPPERVEG